MFDLVYLRLVSVLFRWSFKKIRKKYVVGEFVVFTKESNL